jgi:hypothetical protein
MLDIARVVALLFALAACRQARYGLGVLAALAIAALLAWDIGAPLARHAVGEAGPGSAFAFAFLGPSQLAPRVWLPVAQGVLAGGAAAIAFARSRPLRPEGEPARAWDRAGLRFLFVAVVDGLVVVFDLLLAGLMWEP